MRAPQIEAQRQRPRTVEFSSRVLEQTTSSARPRESKRPGAKAPGL